ncbi:PDR/VanB family oxidoreductase [Planosporangium flavigriseum]
MTVMMESAPETVSDASRDLRQLLVKTATWEADGVLSLRLVDPHGGELPAWEPGAHLDLVLPSGLVRQYSLCGRTDDRRAYTIAVLREVDGRGGSREVHETALVGKTVSVRGPRNRFPLEDAPRYLFLAGGIGITPILAMIREAEARGADWRLAYGGRSRSTMAFVDELVELGRGGVDGVDGVDRVDIVAQDERGLLDLDALLEQAEPGTAVYCCGPEGLLAAAEQRCGDRGISLHLERFGASGAAEPVDDSAEVSFEVELARSGCVVTVPPGCSILDAVRDVAPDVMTSCEEGFCGTCETKVLEGVPDHHDTILSAKERERGQTMMICVGRSKSPRLVLDL